MNGTSLVLDPRIHAYRSDIADIALAGQIFAPHYARPMIRAARHDNSVRENPSDAAPTVTMLAAGEAFAILDITAGWAWGYRRADHHVGYIPVSALDFD